MVEWGTTLIDPVKEADLHGRMVLMFDPHKYVLAVVLSAE